jgi:response regulator RpfG family c-di-GMP phosphodiesterase
MNSNDADRDTGPAAANGEFADLRAEVERLRRENAELSARLDASAAQPGTGGNGREFNGITSLDALRNMVMAAEYKDHDTGAHLVRIGYFSALLASVCSPEGSFAQMLFIASPMHDVGKIGIPDHILKKRSSLSADERRIMEQHPGYGARILEGSDAPMLRLASEIALTHHECYDGSGYPRGLKGKDIPLCGRIVAVADVLDALVMDRSYRSAMPWDQAIDLVKAGRGGHFDPEVVDAFLSVEDRVLDLRDTMVRGETPQRLPGLAGYAGVDPLGFYGEPLNSAASGRHPLDVDTDFRDR